jgi:two-component system response regulator
MMGQSKNSSATILVADDDPDDRLLVRRSLGEAGFAGNLQFVNDGVELMEYLCWSKCQRSEEASPHPDLILLDLNMPREDGRETLRNIEADLDLHGIIVVALTGSESPNDANTCYRLGAKCLMSKPESYTMWVQMMDKILGFLT